MAVFPGQTSGNVWWHHQGLTMPMFRKSQFRWDCDECGVPFYAGDGGVCMTCKRSLCERHFYGSRLSRILATFRPVRQCVTCAAKSAR